LEKLIVNMSSMKKYQNDTTGYWEFKMKKFEAGKNQTIWPDSRRVWSIDGGQLTQPLKLKKKSIRAFIKNSTKKNIQLA
jgi:5-methylcytosine-specific restriction endonuclease McrBC GTP-binding regulatory subunit McrB